MGCLRAARDLHNKLLKNTMRLPMSFFDTTPLGRILNRFSKDVDVIDNVLPMSMRFWIMMFFNVLSVLVVISYSTPLFLSVIVPIGIMYYFIQVSSPAFPREMVSNPIFRSRNSMSPRPVNSSASSPSLVRQSIRTSAKPSPVSQPSVHTARNRGNSLWRSRQCGGKFIHETFSNFLFSPKRFKKESESRVDYNQRMSYPSIVANRWLAVRLEMVGALVVLFAGLFAVLARATISPAMVGLSISYALQISQTLSMLVRMTAEVETNIVAIERGNYILRRAAVNPTWHLISFSVDEYSDVTQEAEWKTVEMVRTSLFYRLRLECNQKLFLNS